MATTNHPPNKVCDVCDDVAAVVHCTECQLQGLGYLCAEDDTTIHQQNKNKLHTRQPLQQPQLNVLLNSQPSTLVQGTSTPETGSLHGLRKNSLFVDDSGTHSFKRDRLAINEPLRATLPAGIGAGAFSSGSKPGSVSSSSASSAASTLSASLQPASSSYASPQPPSTAFSHTMGHITPLRSSYSQPPHRGSYSTLQPSPALNHLQTPRQSVSAPNSHSKPAAAAAERMCDICESDPSAFFCESCKREASIKSTYYCHDCNDLFHNAKQLKWHIRAVYDPLKHGSPSENGSQRPSYDQAASLSSHSSPVASRRQSAIQPSYDTLSVHGADSTSPNSQRRSSVVSNHAVDHNQLSAASRQQRFSVPHSTLMQITELDNENIPSAAPTPNHLTQPHPHMQRFTAPSSNHSSPQKLAPYTNNTGTMVIHPQHTAAAASRSPVQSTDDHLLSDYSHAAASYMQASAAIQQHGSPQLQVHVSRATFTPRESSAATSLAHWQSLTNKPSPRPTTTNRGWQQLQEHVTIGKMTLSASAEPIVVSGQIIHHPPPPAAVQPAIVASPISSHPSTRPESRSPSPARQLSSSSTTATHQLAPPPAPRRRNSLVRMPDAPASPHPDTSHLQNTQQQLQDLEQRLRSEITQSTQRSIEERQQLQQQHEGERQRLAAELEQLKAAAEQLRASEAAREGQMLATAEKRHAEQQQKLQHDLRVQELRTLANAVGLEIDENDLKSADLDIDATARQLHEAVVEVQEQREHALLEATKKSEALEVQLQQLVSKQEAMQKQMEVQHQQQLQQAAQPLASSSPPFNVSRPAASIAAHTQSSPAPAPAAATYVPLLITSQYLPSSVSKAQNRHVPSPPPPVRQSSPPPVHYQQPQLQQAPQRPAYQHQLPPHQAAPSPPPHQAPYTYAAQPPSSYSSSPSPQPYPQPPHVLQRPQHAPGPQPTYSPPAVYMPSPPQQHYYHAPPPPPPSHMMPPQPHVMYPPSMPMQTQHLVHPRPPTAPLPQQWQQHRHPYADLVLDSDLSSSHDSLSDSESDTASETSASDSDMASEAESQHTALSRGTSAASLAESTRVPSTTSSVQHRYSAYDPHHLHPPQFIVRQPLIASNPAALCHVINSQSAQLQRSRPSTATSQRSQPIPPSQIHSHAALVQRPSSAAPPAGSRANGSKHPVTSRTARTKAKENQQHAVGVDKRQQKLAAEFERVTALFDVSPFVTDNGKPVVTYKATSRSNAVSTDSHQHRQNGRSAREAPARTSRSKSRSKGSVKHKRPISRNVSHTHLHFPSSPPQQQQSSFNPASHVYMQPALLQMPMLSQPAPMQYPHPVAVGWDGHRVPSPHPPQHYIQQPPPRMYQPYA